ncbi:hypothetical protein CQW23_13554 [Capsicum baccatum]|uniref:NB-ARC domain-containing protein n=1 Tax=Capsicum baccatum TaxID=33114 RepID=A0A2G2WGL7_CAPBA|nr:hypothetical protein CQW23_13554 [Capsicum baccatum]
MADQIEELKLELAFICTYVQLSHCDLEEFEDEMSDSRQDVENLLQPILDEIDNDGRCEYNMDHVLPSVMDNIDDCISLCHHSTSSATMTDEQLNFLLQNLHYLSMYLAEQIFPLVTQYEIVQKVCGNKRYFHGLILNGYVEHKIVEYVLPQLQRMDEKVGIFFWDDLTTNDSKVFKLAHLRMKIIRIELEVMHICYTNLKPSPAAAVGCFIKKLLETSPEILSAYLIHHEHMVTVTSPSTSVARNIHVTIEFLLIVLTDMPKDFIHHDKLFDLLACVGALIRRSLARVLDVAYEAKDVIDSIIVRDNGLLHLIFSLPITIEKINIIKEEVSQLQEKIPKNNSLIVVNSPKNPVERKLFTTGKIIVGFKEDTNWLISKFTSGSKDLDVISITVNQDYDEKKLLIKLFNQVTGSDLKFSEDIDVADKLRKKLLGKRYLIVLDDVWNTTTLDDLTRPFPEGEKGSRILRTTQQQKVAFHGKCNTDPLNLRLLRREESWELLVKRAFGEESFPDELLNVGKEIAENCKGLPLVADLIAGVIAGREKQSLCGLKFEII